MIIVIQVSWMFIIGYKFLCNKLKSIFYVIVQFYLKEPWQRELIENEYVYLRTGFIDTTFNLNDQRCPLTDIGSIARNGTYVPLVHIISSRINEAALNIGIHHFKKYSPRFSPVMFMSDKDLAAGNTIEVNFPEATRKYCIFHVFGKNFFIFSSILK